MSFIRALEISLDIIAGLAELHELGFMALKLKPDSVLMTDMTETGSAVLSDFASSRIIRKATGRNMVQVRIKVYN